MRYSKRSMPPRPRYHAEKRWTGERGNEIRALAGALARLLEEENVQNEWRGVPPRSFPRAPYPRQRRPYLYGNQRWEKAWPRRPPRARPRDPRPCMLPRRGPPVAFMRVPRRYQNDQWETRQPRGSDPRGTLRGGPERPADDPWRKPRGGVCRPRKVSQGTTDPTQTESCKDQWGKPREAKTAG